MKVWFPTIRADSGADVFTRRLADVLNRIGIPAEATFFSQRYELAPFLLRTFPLPPGTQVIHTNSWSGFAFARSGIPLVVTEHLNVLDPLYRPSKSLAQQFYHQTLIRRFMRASFALASSITVVSSFLRSSLSATLPTLPATVIHNWIDTKIFCPQLTTASGTGRPFRLLFVGNPSRRKGADLLAPIMRELGPGFELRFTRATTRRNSFSVAPNMTPVERLLRDQDLVAAYHQCDALLYPTRFEGFGLSVIESMACGKPVVASNCCSLPEIVGDGIGGILCPPNNIRAFARACSELARHRKFREQLARNARERAQELFSQERIIPQYVALYEKLVK